jgi:hypothetical protein
LGTFSIANAQSINYSQPASPWNADSLGNHRAVIQFNGSGTVAKVHIPWRRRDTEPEKKRILVQDGKTGAKINNILLADIGREAADIYFEPVSGPGTYYVYYMPYKNEGRSNYPKGVYLAPEQTADPAWLINAPTAFATASFLALQSVDAFNSFYPMELIATNQETTQILKGHEQEPFIVFPEDRLHPAKMKDDLPLRWIENGIQNMFAGTAARGEYFCFQLAVYAQQSITDLKITCSDLVSKNGKHIPATAFSCINTNGIAYDGKPFLQSVNVPAHTVQSMWMGLQVPMKTDTGNYLGMAVVSSKDGYNKKIPLQITISQQQLADGGIEEPWKMTRLKWLNSTLAQENTVIAPYTALTENNNSIGMLGRKLVLDNVGLPKQIQTFFNDEMTGLQNEPNNLLSSPVHFEIETEAGKMLLRPVSFSYTKKTAGTIQWRAIAANADLRMEVNGSLEFDGFAAYQIKLTATNTLSIKDIRMVMPFNKDAATYMMGLGQKGGLRPESFEWKWDVAHKNQDGLWMGSVQAGLQFSLRDENYIRPLNTNFYLQKPLILPASWGNEGKGGIAVKEQKQTVSITNYSGARQFEKGSSLYYNFNLLITPFHTINTDFQWANRFYHKYQSPDSIRMAGATVVNIHHATPINPWINYPFIEFNKMKRYIDSAHQLGLKVKIYNTVREVSNRAYELPVLRSLGHEIYSPGKGGGFSWLQEHLGNDYIAAWFVPEIKDAALINSGMTRWHNYYVEGMNWLVKNTGIDGIYLDDVAFDRITMKRIKRVLTQDGHPGFLDLHSANQFNKNDGFNNSANLYLEHFPYLNRLWFGEYFDYEKNEPEFFLTEVSGIPFGLMGEMLQDGGNPWRGMIYGMTSRMPWSKEADPAPVWKAWDDFGMQGSSMIGYWSKHCPVHTSKAKVLATVYKKKGKTMISIASWEATDTNIYLQIDWKALGLDPQTASITAPAIEHFQEGKTFKPTDAIPVSKNKGWLLVIQ